MKSETSAQHQKEASKELSCGIITLSDSRKSEKLDLSGKLIAEEIEARYTLKSKKLIPDEADDLINTIENMISNGIDVILTTSGTLYSSGETIQVDSLLAFTALLTSVSLTGTESLITTPSK